ncbi:MAG: HU family DNA-binding protein [Candidatus Nanoarchaeia archaeon]
MKIYFKKYSKNCQFSIQEKIKMTKRDFVVKIASEVDLTQNQVSVVVQKFLDCVANELASGKTIELRNFGIFEIKTRRSRIGRNPKTPKNEVIIPERTVVKFRAGKELKERVELLGKKKASASKPTANKKTTKPAPKSKKR